jgi:hypothetical protein
VWFSVKNLTVVEIHSDIGNLPRYLSDSFYQQILPIAILAVEIDKEL